MLRPEDLRKVLLLWWDRPEMNCPCVIEETQKDSSFVLRSIHGSTVVINPRHPIMQELRICSQEEVMRYIARIRGKLEEEVREAEQALRTKQASLENMKTYYSEALDRLFFTQQEELPPISA